MFYGALVRIMVDAALILIGIEGSQDRREASRGMASLAQPGGENGRAFVI